MEIKQNFNFYDLKNECWSGAIDTLETIEENDQEEELMELLEDSFSDIPTLTEVNDFLRFENDFIFEQLNIEEESEEEE